MAAVAALSAACGSDSTPATVSYCRGSAYTGGEYFLTADVDVGDGPCSMLTEVSADEFNSAGLTKQCAKRQDSPPRTLSYYSTAEPDSVAAAKAMCESLSGTDVG